MVTYEDLRKNAEINTYITRADESLSALGFWDTAPTRSSLRKSPPISTISATWSTGWTTPRAGR